MCSYPVDRETLNHGAEGWFIKISSWEQKFLPRDCSKMLVLTHICANALEYARTRDDRQNDQHSENPGRTGLTSAGRELAKT